MTIDQLTAEDSISIPQDVDIQTYDVQRALIEYHQLSDQRFNTFQDHLQLGDGYLLFVEGHPNSLEAEIKWDEHVIATVSIKPISMAIWQRYPSGRIDVQYGCKVTIHRDTIKFGNQIKVPLATDLSDAQLPNESALPVYELFNNAVEYARRELFTFKL